MTQEDKRFISIHFQNYKEHKLGIAECHTEEENDIITIFPTALPLKEAGRNLIEKGFENELNKVFLKLYDQSPLLLGERIQFLDSTPMLLLNFFIPLIVEKQLGILLKSKTKLSEFGFELVKNEKNIPLTIFYIKQKRIKHYFCVIYMEEEIDYILESIQNLDGKVHILIPKFRTDLVNKIKNVVFLDNVATRACINPRLKIHFSEFKKKYLFIKSRFSDRKTLHKQISSQNKNIIE